MPNPTRENTMTTTIPEPIPAPAPAPVPAPPAAGAPAPAPAAPEPADTEGNGAEDPVQELAKWKALARKHEAQAKANADKALKFDAAEDAAKTELQRATDRANTLESEAKQARLDALRARTASAKGVPEALLTGSTQEELDAAADALLAFRGPAGPASSGPNPSGNGGAPARTFSQAQLSNHEFYEANRDDILDAFAHGRITP